MIELKYDEKLLIAVTIMIIGLIINFISLIFNYPDYWDGGSLIFLIGLTLSTIIVQTELKRYKEKYGELGE